MIIDYNALAEDYVRHRRTHPGVLQALLAEGHIGTRSRVLEVGCGTGNYITAIADITGCVCHGIDPSPQMLQKARARTTAVAFVQGRAEALGQPTNDYDLVFSVDVIHHINDRASYYRGAERILRPGGRICAVTDSESIIRSRMPLSVYFPETVDAELRRYPPVSQLRAEMVAAGFADITESTVEFPYMLTDCCAYETKAYSALRLIPQEVFERGIAQMRNDLHNGPIACNSRYILLWGVKTKG